MSIAITPIALPMPLGMGLVNSYLLRAGDGCILVDTGAPNARSRLLARLQELGCLPGMLRLIVITHGDFDHTGSAAYLRLGLASRIGMHADDAPMAEAGDMFANRTRPNPILRALVPRLIGFGGKERFTADTLLDDGASLAEYGLDARVVAIPGHSPGSIGLLTAGGDFFCGDLYESTREPVLNGLLDDRSAALASDAHVRGLPIRKIYPGHGAAFTLDQLAEASA